MLLRGHTHPIQLSSALPRVCGTACAQPHARGGTSERLVGLQWEFALRCALLGARAPLGLCRKGSGIPWDAEPKGGSLKSSLLCLE